MNKAAIGMKGQEYAEYFLKRKGYKLVERNWRSPMGEIDLVFLRRGVYIFVEVKAMIRILQFFQPEDHLTTSKERKLKQLALAYGSYEDIQDSSYQIDLVAVDFDETFNVKEIRHYENIIEE